MIPKMCDVAQGLKLRVFNTDKFKAGMLSLSAALPIHPETAYKTTLLLSVLRRGTEKYPTLAQINRRLDYLYGTELSIRNFYRGDMQVIGFSAELLDDSYLPSAEESLLDGALDVMCQILFHPCLDDEGCLLEKYVEQEKQLQCDQIRAAKNHPRAYAAERCRELLYRDEPCGTSALGDEEAVMAVTSRELTAHWRALLSKLCFDCAYIGPASEDTVRSALMRSVVPMLACKKKAAPHCPTVVKHVREMREVEEELEVTQGHLVLGLRCGFSLRDPEFYACAVYNEMLGVSPVSKLFVNVREKKSLCYHCSSAYNVYKGTILISCGLENSNRPLAQQAITEQLEALAKGEFTDEELDAAKRSLEHSYRMLEDSPAAMESYYFGRGLVGVTDSPENSRACFARVTREDVLAVAKGVAVDVIYYLKGTLAGGEEEGNDDDLD